jgi:hypothetical protein
VQQQILDELTRGAAPVDLAQADRLILERLTTLKP